MTTYKIISIDQTTGNINVVFSIDGKEQTLGGKTLNDPVQLDLELTEYGVAYEAGLNLTSVEVNSEVAKLIGKAQEIDATKLEES